MITATTTPRLKGRHRQRPELLADEFITDLSELFRALGDPTRLKIVLALSRGELCVADLAGAIDTSESAVSHQLRHLKTLRLIRSRKAGKQVYYCLDDEHVEDLLRVGRDHIGEFSR